MNLVQNADLKDKKLKNIYYKNDKKILKVYAKMDKKLQSLAINEIE